MERRRIDGKTFSEIKNDPKDHRTQELDCGCVVQRIGKNKYMTPVKCSKHLREFNDRQAENKRLKKAVCVR